MNRIDLQRIAEERARDAEALLAAGQWSGAYYLAGYAVECGLKARIARQIGQHEFPDKELTQRCYTHNIDKLIEVANLGAARAVDMAANPIRGRYWLVVKDWNEAARYQIWLEKDARDLVNAVMDPSNGVLPWITGHW